MSFSSFYGVNQHRQSILLGCSLITSEDAKTYKYVFSTWIRAMNNVPPATILTDQCESIKASIREVMPDAIHKICDVALDSDVKIQDFINVMKARLSAYLNWKDDMIVPDVVARGLTRYSVRTRPNANRDNVSGGDNNGGTSTRRCARWSARTGTNVNGGDNNGGTSTTRRARESARTEPNVNRDNANEGDVKEDENNGGNRRGKSSRRSTRGGGVGGGRTSGRNNRSS
ncbi:hypothetical protein RND71_014583 [Anisodus tanguticus]|uniref:MULE transposase domain-containing protein n=1 Tax=Anisodus tanguticus TaxID=243964 RepID=A0AAE1S9Y9_9SOLA|nr:hypothetical protein RND71_014583 [Anisodus tanguticus]